MRATAETSVACFYEHVVPNLSRGQYQTILAAMYDDRDYSLTEISRLTGIDKSTVSARVNEMRAANLLEPATKRKCTLTNITVIPSRKPVRGQMGLFG